ncbi:DNA-directed RNA polymerase subunit beta [Candidatus Entotheonellaceae bacterium PAL068K]
MAVSETSMANMHDDQVRRDFARIPTIIDLPDLIEVQQKSYARFLQQDRPPRDREDRGLEAVFRSVFPISDFNGTASLEYVGYEIGEWKAEDGDYKGLGGIGVLSNRSRRPLSYHERYDVRECRQKGITYADPLRVMVRLVVRDKGADGEPAAIREMKEEKVYLGEIPLMTEKGTFIINGTERVIVSQLHRSPGVFFAQEKGRSTASGKLLYSARLIPYRGSWLDFEFDAKDQLYVRIDRRRKFPVTILLRALGLSKQQDILQTFYNREGVRYNPDSKTFYKHVSELLLQQYSREDVLDPTSGDPIVRARRRISRSALRRLFNSEIEEIPWAEDDLIGQVVAEDIIDPTTAEVLIESNHELAGDDIEKLKARGVTDFQVLYLDPLRTDPSLRLTLATDRIKTQDEALLDIYKRLRPGDIPTKETARLFFDNLFFNTKRYDLARIGRLKLNTKLGLDLPLETRMLTTQDIVKLVGYLLALRQGDGTVDDIDHLGNRRVRSVGELLENQLRIGLVRMERTVRERMTLHDLEAAMPHDLINSKPVTAAVKEFFGSSQLSQFMDQTNPLSEITHKRRLSALGPGGLTRDRAGFEVRDVHPTHYGRICPIETPEGLNTGLIASLSTYARINRFGFIETPYRRVKQGKVTDDIEFLSAIEEDRYVIAQANAEVIAEGEFVRELISARRGGEFIFVPPGAVDYMDVSPKQLVSVAAALIPFLENDDANRALMGSNMQRQAVPLLRTEAPLVGTGMEAITARDSGSVVLAKAAGEVVNVDASRIVVRVDEESHGNAPRVDIYSLVKYQRSNQSTCINQRPMASLGQRVNRGDVLADGPATDQGKLALGRNVLVAFMPWGGYNFEDAIVISERVVKEDIFTSIHIDEFEVEACDTKQGREEITRDIPNVGEEALKDLDESGIIRIGAKVKPGDLLVGKITPKGETQLSPEEKLLKAIFGEKAGDVRDTSLTTPPGIEGVIVGVQVFSRRGAEKDERMRVIEEEDVARIEKDYYDEIKIVEEECDRKVRRLLVGKTVADDVQLSGSHTASLAAGETCTEDILAELSGKALFDVPIVEAELVEDHLRDIGAATREHVYALQVQLKEKIKKLRQGDELPPGVIKLVKVFVAMKRKLSVGDKMAGRHGNKGVVSIVVPEEDMPYLDDGTPVDLVLNPLGVPSRMNVGQILETHLGWAAKHLKWAVASPVFDGATEQDIKKALRQAALPEDGRTTLYDGKTGEPFDQRVVVGQIYMMKLHHLVDDKIHARSTGPYSLVTQQPLGGKAQFGGQRLGEMEVWALKAYGAARTLQEMLTVKSDDVIGRTRMYEAIVKGENTLEASLPESFNVLVKELQSLALDVELLEAADLPPDEQLEEMSE